jgi:hypothetical protein
VCLIKGVLFFGSRSEVVDTDQEGIDIRESIIVCGDEPTVELDHGIGLYMFKNA